MELREPKRKRRVRISLQQPFPILNRDVASMSTNRVLWQIYTGRYSGDFVVVDAPDEMAALHNMGFFGKGSLSRGAPEFAKEKQGSPSFVRQRQWERRCKWAKQQEELVKNFKKAHKKAVAGHTTHEVEQIASTRTETNQVDKTSVQQDKKVESSSDETKKDDDVNDKGEEMHIDVTTVDDNKESHNADEDIITLDSAEEDNGNKNDSTKEKVTKNSNDKNGMLEKEEIKQGCDTKRKNVEDLEESCSIEEHFGESSEKRMLLVLPDSDDDDEQYLTNICPRLEEEPFPLHESLHLTLEEAFFLSYGLGCLQVLDMFGNILSVDGMWQLFCKSQKDFIEKYVGYHYFRSKGWVVKPGIKFGGDFLLYKQGPPFYHASYMAVLEVVDSPTLKRHPAVRRTLTWMRLMGLNRLAETAGKEVLLCQIMWPSEVGPESLQNPSVISKFQVHEVLVRRWVSSQEREENDSI